jgi:hypothetical protein
VDHLDSSGIRNRGRALAAKFETCSNLPRWNRTDDLLEAVKRGRDGFRAIAASIDLVGMKNLMARRPGEARARLDDLQQGFGEALIFHPGGEAYRVCFAGDSVFVVQELDPDAEADEGAVWASFCGHIFALGGFLNDMDRGIGNPGLRVFVAAGPLFQLTKPDSWRTLPWSQETANWFVLTGASVALAKVWEAEKAGRGGGFDPGYCWHELLGAPGTFLGTTLRKIGPEYSRQRALYPEVYREMIHNANRKTQIEGWPA